MPIKEPGGEVLGVAQVINKIGSKDQHEAFTDSDEKVSALFDDLDLEIAANQNL